MESAFPDYFIRILEYGALFGLLAGVPLIVLTLAKTRKASGPVAVIALLITLGYAWWRESQPPPPPPPAPEPVVVPPPLTLKKMGPVEEPAPPPPPPPPEPEPVAAAPEPEPAKPAAVKKCGYEILSSRVDAQTKRLEVKACGADARGAKDAVMGEAIANAQRGAKKDDYLKFKARWKETIAEAISDGVKISSTETTPRGTVVIAYVALDEVTRQLKALGFSDRFVQPGFKVDNMDTISTISSGDLERVIMEKLRKQSNYSLNGGIFADPKLLKDELRNLDVVYKQVRYIIDVKDMLDVGGSEDSEEYIYVLTIKLGASD